uniref:limulus clotting factor C-like n=1 Tax=Ciona intestinalis TaxID=7719 RepID=UPI000EF490EE|nr:limulus clotting factor C-like [Ciona intestinalis]|eukprot:XP_009857750.3 limulus clotting factor C-like [Ciona intestinalis]
MANIVNSIYGAGCRPPALTPHLYYSFGERELRYGAEVWYRCESEYRLLGSNVAVCTARGRWSNQPPVCVSKCPRPSNPNHGYVDELSGLTVTYGCDVGYVLEGSHRSRCLRNGNWDLNPPTCAPLLNVEPSSDLLSQGNVRGSVINGNDVTNTEISCFRLLNPVGGRVRLNMSSDVIITGTMALYSCIGDDVILIGNSTRVCLNTGGWSGYAPLCLKVCRDPGIPTYADKTIIYPDHVVEDGERHLVVGTRIKFSCMFPDLRIVGVKLRVCLEDGSWSGTRNPLCLPRCGLFPMTSEILGTVPWHVTILRRNTVTNRWHPVCNGAFIGDNLIITSAQCVTYSFTNLKYNVSSMVVGIGDVTRTVIRHKYHISRILIHHNYDPMLRHNDVALLVMTSSVPIDFSGEIWPICLRASNKKRSKLLAARRRGLMSSWSPYMGCHVRNPSANGTRGCQDNHREVKVFNVTRAKNIHCSGKLRMGGKYMCWHLPAQPTCPVAIGFGQPFFNRVGSNTDSNAETHPRGGGRESYVWVLTGIGRAAENCNDRYDSNYIAFSKVDRYLSWIRQCMKVLRNEGELYRQT